VARQDFIFDSICLKMIEISEVRESIKLVSRRSEVFRPIPHVEQTTPTTMSQLSSGICQQLAGIL
jgi:hypothetical protein